MRYPIVERNGQVKVLIKLRGQSIWREGMFYMNGGKPTFASYGTDVTANVDEWKLPPLAV